MSDFAPFLSPLPQDNSIRPGANGRVHLPSLMHVFPFEGAPPFSIGADLASLKQKDDDCDGNKSIERIGTSNELRTTNFKNFNEPDSDVLHLQSSNRPNNKFMLNASQQTQLPSFHQPQENLFFNLSNQETHALMPIQNSSIADSSLNSVPISPNYQNFNNPFIQHHPQQIQLQTSIIQPNDQFIQPQGTNFQTAIINNYQTFINPNQPNSVIFQQTQNQQQPSIKLQDSPSSFQFYAPINSQVLKPVVNSTIEYAIQPNIANNSFYMKPQNSFKTQQANLPISKMPIYSFRMRSNRRYSEKELLDITINPIELNFLPKEFWLTPQTTIKQVVQSFFKARSTKNLRFEHKLWNALILSTNYPELISILGIYWISIDILKVNRDIFGALINVTKPAAALFNSQGSFLTHGFVEVSKEEALKVHMIKDELVEDVDESVVRLFRHSAGLLKANSHKGDLVTCRWNK